MYIIEDHIYIIEDHVYDIGIIHRFERVDVNHHEICQNKLPNLIHIMKLIG